MKKAFKKTLVSLIFTGLCGSLTAPIHAQAPSEHQEERSHLQRFKTWLRGYGTPRKDIRFLWNWGKKVVRREKRKPEENEKAHAIMKRWGIPIGALLLVFASGTLLISLSRKMGNPREYAQTISYEGKFGKWVQGEHPSYFIFATHATDDEFSRVYQKASFHHHFPPAESFEELPKKDQLEKLFEFVKKHYELEGTPFEKDAREQLKWWHLLLGPNI